jgi:hypothetical protein
MYRVEYGQTPHQRLQDRLDRMVAAIWPTRISPGSPISTAEQFDYQGIAEAVELAWRLLKAVEDSIGHEAAMETALHPEVQTAEQQAREEKLNALIEKMRVT